MYHSTKRVARMGVLSFKSHAAGSPVAMVIKPMSLNVHGVPTLSIIADMARLILAPPRPPPAKTRPFARPLRLWKYCAGMTDTTMKQQLRRSARYLPCPLNTANIPYTIPHDQALRKEEPYHTLRRPSTPDLPHSHHHNPKYRNFPRPDGPYQSTIYQGEGC